MSVEDKEKIINNINATMEIENEKLTSSEKKLLEDCADNKISLEDAIEIIKKYILKKV